MEFKRYENETDDELIYRICSQKEMIGCWQDVADILNDILDENDNESKYRKAYQAQKKIIDLKQESLADINEQLDELEDLKNELYKERVKLQDVQRLKRKDLREESRFENLLEVLENLQLSNITINEYKPINKNEKRKSAILQFSDWHCGAIIDNQFNYYDIDTMVGRATTIRDKALYYCNIHKVTDLIVEINGDMVDGLIHISSRVEQEEGVVSQIMTVTDILIKIINSMKPYFNSIKVVTTLGNHGRLTSNKNDSITKENFEMIIPWGLRKELNDVVVIDSKGLDFTKYDVDGKIILLSHGQNDKLSSVVEDFIKMYKIVPDEIHLGHTHSYKDINDCDIFVTVNGCLDGSDDYSLTIRKVTTPSQNLIIYENDRCIYKLNAE